MKAKSPTTSCISKGNLTRFALLTVGAMFLAACSSGLEQDVPELENAASTKKTESRVSSYSDNAEERSSGLVINSSTDIELTHDVSRGQQLVGLRFRDVKVPRGAKIEDAYIQFKADETDSDSVKVRIRGDDTDDASGFSQGYNEGISKRSKTSASVSWDIDSWKDRGDRGSAQRTPNLDDIIEEVTGRKGWDSGNSLAFIIDGDDKNDRRVAESYRGDEDGAPKLVIEYSGGDSSSGNRSAPVSSGPKVDKGDADWYVSPSGSDSNSGRSKGEPFETLLKVSEVVGPGDVVFLRGGTYDDFGQVYFGYDRKPFTRDGKKGAPITIMSYPGERAVLDGGDRSYKKYKSVSSPSVLRILADWYVIQDITIRNGAGRGLYLRGDNNIVRNVTAYNNHSDGLYGSGDNNRFENFESYDNYSRQNGGDSADGLKIVGSDDAVIRNCNVYDNSDDGIDIWDSTDTLIENCTAKDNGRGDTGNGRGYKAGGGGKKNTGTIVRNNKAEGNLVNFDSNRSTGIEFRNNESRNARYVGFEIVKGNKAYDNKSSGDPKNSVKGVSGDGNNW